MVRLVTYPLAAKMDSPFGTSDKVRQNFISKFGRMIVKNAIYRAVGIILIFFNLPQFLRYEPNFHKS
jgi:hypothetical protein